MTLSIDINGLLERRGACLRGKGGNQSSARERAYVSRELASQYAAWDSLRLHLFNPQDCPRVFVSQPVHALAKRLQERGWIRPISRDGSVWDLDREHIDADVERYLRGAWLEEYVWLAYIEAGCDEAYFGQQIEWEVDGVFGLNEIDVIARRGELLSFSSCKAIRTEHTGHNERLREFINEVAYWDWHFADRHARGLLVTTADLIDEMRGHLPRFPALMARAKVLDIGVTGFETLSWAPMLSAVHAHWMP